MSLTIKKYKHAPTHWFIDNTIYFFTGATYQRKRLLARPAAKEIFTKYLIQYLKDYGWQLHDWVVLDNHYHFLAEVTRSAQIPLFINTLHKTSAYHIKQTVGIDAKPFWYQYWDRCIRDEKHCFQTAIYILYNPVKHRYVEDINEYRFSSFHLRKEQEEEALTRNLTRHKPQAVQYYDNIDDF